MISNDKTSEMATTHSDIEMLSFLNISNRENIAADSGYLFLKSLLDNISLGFNTVCGPQELKNLEANIIPIDIGTSKYRARYDFPWKEISGSIRNSKPDIIFNNQIEFSPDFKALLTASGLKIPIVSYCHYIPLTTIDQGISYDPSQNDNGLAEISMNRIIDGAFCSDITLVQSNYAKDLLMSYTEQYYKTRDLSELSEKIKILPPPIETKQFAEIKPKRITENKTCIIYNHRLYAHYGTQKVFDWLNEFNKEHSQSFEVWVSAPTRKRSVIRNDLDNTPNKLLEWMSTLEFTNTYEAESREDYLSIIKGADFGLAPFRQNAVWSMSVGDLIGAGKPVIAPKLGSFPEMLPSETIFEPRSKKQFFKQLSYLIDNPDRRMELGGISQSKAKQYSTEVIASKFTKLIGDLIDSFNL